METFVIASNNPKKVQELNRILNPMGITAKTAKEQQATIPKRYRSLTGY